MTELEKAVKHFKGVWPEGWENMIVSTYVNIFHGYGCYQDFNGDKTYLESVSGFYPYSWHWVCNKEQFMKEAKKMNLRDKSKNYWNGTDPFEVGHIVKQGESVAVDGDEVCIKSDEGLSVWNTSFFRKLSQ